MSISKTERVRPRGGPMARERIRICEVSEAECEVHDWPTEGLGKRMVEAMRASFPTGVNVCRACVVRARDDARAKASQ